MVWDYGSQVSEHMALSCFTRSVFTCGNFTIVVSRVNTLSLMFDYSDFGVYGNSRCRCIDF